MQDIYLVEWKANHTRDIINYRQLIGFLWWVLILDVQFIVQYVSTNNNSVSIILVFFIPAFGKIREQGSLLSFFSCLKSYKCIRFPSIFGKCSLLLVHFWLSFTWARPMNQLTWPPAYKQLFWGHTMRISPPETAAASQILTCRPIMVWFFNWLELHSLGILWS